MIFRIISARRKIRFAVDESVDIPDKRALAPVSRLEIAKEAIASFRGNANPGIRDKLLSKHIASGIEKTSDADEMESFQQYLMEEMSNAVVHASHWRTEWEEIVKQESQCRDQKSPDRGIGVEASLAEHLHGSDVRLADLLGVSTEGNKGGEVFADNMAVVSGMQWRLTRGVLRIGADAFAESAV